MAIEVKTPFEFFPDTSGLPLDGGRIYIGEIGLDPVSNPQTVYWDEPLTIEAAQPISTIGGFPARDGSAAKIYIPGTYSIRVEDSDGALVFSSLENGIPEFGVSAIFTRSGSFVGDGVSSSFTILGLYDVASQVTLEIGGAEQAPDRYTVSAAGDGFSSVVTWLGHEGVSPEPFPLSADVVWNTRSKAAGVPGSLEDLAAEGFSDGQASVSARTVNFDSRASLVTWWGTYAALVPAGAVLSDGSVQYLKMPAGHVLFGTDPIADLPGLVPFGDWYADHFGARTTAPIQAAIDVLSSFGGGVLHFFPGEYQIDGTAGGRGLLLKDYVRLKGASTMGTVLKNVSDEWNAVLSVQGVDGIGVSDLTIDGDWPTLAPHPSDAIRGEGIVFFNDTTNPLRSAVFERLYIKNCAHYGFGAQNVSHEGVLIDSIVFENTGGDALDIKSFTSPTTAGPDRATTVSNIWVKSFQQNTDHDDQAGLDIRGVVNVENIYISDTWDLKAGQTRKAGIRFNSDVTAQNRIGGHKSTLHGAYVGSSKPDTSGNFTDEVIVGVEVSADFVSVSGATVENQLVGYRVVSTGDTPNPRGVRIQGKAINCKSDTTTGVGVDVGSDCRDVSVDVMAHECETGFNIRGLAHDVQGIAEGCDVGLRYNQTSKSNIEVVCSNCTTDVIEASGRYAEASNIANDGAAVIGPRRVFTDIVSTANDSGWTGDDAVLGGLQFFKYDASAGNAGLFGSIEMRATDLSGGNFATWITVQDAAGTMVDVLEIQDGRIRAKVPVELPRYSVANLPSGVSDGATAFVLDATSTAFGTVVVGGGSNKVPVYFDNPDWRVG